MGKTTLLSELIRQTQLLQRQHVEQQDVIFRLQSRLDSLEIELKTKESTAQTLSRASAALDQDNLRNEFSK